MIPALNAGDTIGATLESVAPGRDAGLVSELIVCDAGSTDETLAVAERYGAVVEVSKPGRGVQLAMGAAAAESAWLLFLHADTRLSEGWELEASEFILRKDSEERAAVFTFALDDPSPTARRLERYVKWRCRTMGLPYGDQGLLLSRKLYDAIGRFRFLPLMEDVDIVRRLTTRRLVFLAATATTSAARYRREGFFARGARNLFCLALYFAGVPPRIIARLYH